MSVDQQLQREGEAGRRAALAAVGAVVSQVAGLALFILASPGRTSDSPGQVLEVPVFYRDHAVSLIAGAALTGLGYVLVAVALDHLYRPTRRRRPQTPGIARVTAYLGSVALAGAIIAQQVIRTLASAEYLARESGNYFAARDVASSPEVVLAALRGGTFALGFAFVLISLNAMRAGLLTRFMGVLGVIVGVFVVFEAPPVIQWFWLGALAYLYLGRWPGGVPPAWRTGRAEPWPTARELRQRHGADAEPGPEPNHPPQPPAPPASSRRRRKKRR